ncbi:glycosyltransferase [Corynebacterium sp. zg254]|uniref:Glycosyltransferase n=1 Tax=Corynebacterium zhongnanshanii TaxID=2768834 RepID=A0ABQ6VCX5_9CORY|nr:MULTISPECIES: glycosyltransferase [Corynebacterium]KAB3519958.1 glycosyltransferase [Corynebacterium zhongnanshanii]MCR5914907.1 glycosyltransferase [Corynebacterium sp. zg254]
MSTATIRGIHVGSEAFLRSIHADDCLSLCPHDFSPENLRAADNANADPAHYVLLEIHAQKLSPEMRSSVRETLQWLRVNNPDIRIILWQTGATLAVEECNDLIELADILLTERGSANCALPADTAHTLRVETIQCLPEDSERPWFISDSGELSTQITGAIPAVDRAAAAPTLTVAERFLADADYIRRGFLVRDIYDAQLFNSLPSLLFSADLCDGLNAPDTLTENQRELLGIVLLNASQQCMKNYSRRGQLRRILRSIVPKANLPCAEPFECIQHVTHENAAEQKSAQQNPAQQRVVFSRERADTAEDREVFHLSTPQPVELTPERIQDLVLLLRASGLDAISLDWDSLARRFLLPTELTSTELNLTEPEPTELAPATHTPALTLITPVCNNADFYLGRCLLSLLCHSTWDRWQILIVDDGSTPSDSLSALERLDRLVPQMTVLRAGATPSGSASRPRNRGIDAARGDFVAFLDPDNEISFRGYDRLLERAGALHRESRRRQPDFLVGYQRKIATNTVGTDGYYEGLKGRCFALSARAFLWLFAFPVIPTQSSLISRALLHQSGIRFVEGGVGQDSLFGWQIAVAARQRGCVTDAYVNYYAEREGSVTNVITADYFRKSLLREKQTARWLREKRLFRRYRATKYRRFMWEWYVPKLAQVPHQERRPTLEYIREIADLYNHG